MLTDKEIIAATGKYGAAKEMVCNIGRLVIAEYEKKLREQEPVYQVWRSTDNCNEFYSWDDCDKSDYDLASEEDRRILFEHPAPSAPEGYALVPVEPTDSMLFMITPASAAISEWRANYKSMLAAARSGDRPS